MASILPGYQYDIFISYRHKDNKGGWVSEFVKNLRNEIEATFKEDISIYFDSNPHDGLHETHDVDGSLKEKIKCLVFIPIVSQTYCDPKSFAWQNEFLPFLELARQDPFGLDISLPGGNVAKRVLPIRIHEIYGDDQNLFEQAIGGKMRPADFIYAGAGVNRPLNVDDAKEENLKHTRYKDQINKVANAIKEILGGLSGGISSKGTTATYIDQTPNIKKEWKSFRKKKLWSHNSVTLSIPLLSILAVTLAGVSAWLSWQLTHREENKSVTSFTIPLSNDIIDVADIAISPDGTTIAYAAEHKFNSTRLYLRKLETFETIEFPDKDPTNPKFSPDNKWLVYASENKLIKYSTVNQTKVEICTLPTDWVHGIAWGTNENICLAMGGFQSKDLMRVPSTGGTIEVLIKSNGKVDLNYPVSISGTQDYIFCVADSVDYGNNINKIVVGSVGSDEWKDLGIKGFNPAIHSNGLLSFYANNAIMAVPYNFSERKISLSKVTRVIDRVNNGSVPYAIAENGTLVYVLASLATDKLVLTGKGGIQETLNIDGVSSRIHNPKMSPDGTKISFLDGNHMLCVYDLKRKTLEKVSSWRWSNNVWSPDSRYLYYHGGIASTFSIYAWEVNSNKTPEVIYRSEIKNNVIPSSISKDGRLLIFDGVGYSGIYILDLKTKTISPYLQTDSKPHGAQISPDSKWMLYSSLETGQNEVYVGSVSNSKNKWLISNNGGSEPTWSKDGRWIFYRSADKFESVKINTGNTIEILSREILFADNMKIHQFGETNYDLTSDGQRFLGIKSEFSGRPEIRVVLNWYDQIKNNF
jgi:Tol biopolymer transport system component